MDESPDAKRMKLRYAGTCRICQAQIPARTEAVYERTTKSVRCVSHDHEQSWIRSETSADPAVSDAPEIEAGTPGESARREFERRHQARDDRVRAKHPKLGGLILAFGDDPQSTRAWETGAVGEEKLGARLNDLSSASLLVLHDRRIPRTKANIDHLVISPTGIWVVDAKRYQGRPSLKVEGGILRPRTEKLLVGSRDCTRLVDGMLRQIEVVQDALLPGHRPDGPGRPWGPVPVHGVLCFVDADWPLTGGTFTTRGVDVTWPKKLFTRLQLDGPMAPSSIAEIHRHLAGALPRA